MAHEHLGGEFLNVAVPQNGAYLTVLLSFVDETDVSRGSLQLQAVASTERSKPDLKLVVDSPMQNGTIVWGFGMAVVRLPAATHL